jgi:cytoskeletal protein CcmA (bactofilin family)
MLTIGEGVLIEGKVSAPGTVHIHGHVTGDVQAADVLVGATGRVDGSLTADDVDVRGRVGDSVRASNRVTIRATAWVHGKLRYQTLQIEGGARIDGNLQQVRVETDGHDDISDVQPIGAPQLEWLPTRDNN